MHLGNVTIRALARDDLPAVVAIDAAHELRSRRAYIERRLTAALREPKLHAQFAAVDAQGLAGCIMARVLEGEFGRDIPSQKLGERVMKQLRKLDPVAYVRFVSVYRKFADVDQFIKEIKQLGKP